MLPRRLAVVACLVICGCVSAPERPPEPEPFEAGGLPFASSARVGLLVSGEVSPKDPSSSPTIVGLAVDDASEVAQAFTNGFRVHLPDANFGVVDEALRRNCINSGYKHAGEDSIVLAIPLLTSDSCHAQVERLNLRYLVLIGGARSTASTFKTTAGGGGGGGAAVLATYYSHAMSLRAQVFDTSTGALVCERNRLALGSSYLGVGIFGAMGGAMAIPVFETLDEAAYWKHVAWRLGYVVAGCFVQPTAEGTTSANAKSDVVESTDMVAGCFAQPTAESTTPANAVSDVVDVTDVVFPNAIWWFRRTHRVPGRLLIERGGLVFCERLPSGGEAPYAVRAAEVNSVSIDKSRQEPRFSIHRQDRTAEEFSILRSGSDAIDAESTQSAYELVKDRLVPRAGGYTARPKPSE